MGQMKGAPKTPKPNTTPGARMPMHSSPQSALGYAVDTFNDLPRSAPSNTKYLVLNEMVFYNYDRAEKVWIRCAVANNEKNYAGNFVDKMRIQPHIDNYGKKELPEQIGEREYIEPETNEEYYATEYFTVPVEYSVFGVPIQIGTIQSTADETYIARNYETGDRLIVNISNFVHFIVEKYLKYMGIKYSFEDKIKVYKDSEYYVFIKNEKITVKTKKWFFYRTILNAGWSIEFNKDLSNKKINYHVMKDTAIPTMKFLVETLLKSMENKDREIEYKKEKETLAAEAKKIFYDMLGI